MAPPPAATANLADLPAKPRGKGGLKRVLVLIVTAALFGAGGFGAAWFLYARAPSPMDDALRLIERDSAAPAVAGPEKMRKPVPEEESFVTSYHAVTDPLTTNLSGSRHFLQVSITLSTQYDPKVFENVTKHDAALRSDMLAVIGSFSEADVAGPEGRARLAGGLRDALNTRLTELEGFGGIEGVFFTSFVVQ